MPIYEYRCKSCGHTLEVIQRFSDRPLRKCPECSGRLEKLISRTAFQLKGGGWFAQDYSSRASASASAETPKESGSKPKEGKDGSGKSGSSAS